MTNAEKLAKNTRRLAELLCNEYVCEGCPIRLFCRNNQEILCEEVWKKWLEQETQEDE